MNFSCPKACLTSQSELNIWKTNLGWSLPPLVPRNLTFTRYTEKFLFIQFIQSSCFLKIRQHAKIYTIPRILTLGGLIKLYWESESTSRYLPRRSEAVSMSKVSNCCYRQSRRKTSDLGCPLNEMISVQSGFSFDASCIYMSLSYFSKDCVWLR